MISQSDKIILQDLAKQLAEIASLPIQQQKAELWRRHNQLEHTRPLVYFHMEEFCWPEVLPEEVFQTTGEQAKELEKQLRRRLYEAQYLKDDRVIEPVIEYPLVIQDTGFGVNVQTGSTHQDTGAVCYKPVIQEEKDIDKIKMPDISVDWEATKKKQQQVEELFEGILTPLTRKAFFPMAAFMDWFCMMRGIQQVYLDLIQRPQWIHEVMERMTTGWLYRLKQLEEQGALGLNNGSNEVGSGGLGYTDELPQKDFSPQQIRPMDMWGFCTSQVFASVSPGMHEEFALQYERRYLEKFGLNCYGCCEPLHQKMAYVKKIPRLRRVSMSQWVDREKAAQELGNQYIYSFKPTGNYVSQDTWNPEEVRADLQDVLEKTKGCILELVNNSVSTCRNEPHRIHQWIQIAMELAEQYG